MAKTPSDASRGDVTGLTRGFIVTLTGAVTSGALGYLLVVVVSRGVGAARAGVFFEAVALLSIASVVAELGADDGLVRMVARFRALGRTHDLRTLLAVGLGPVLVAGAALGALLYAFAPEFSRALVHGTRHQGALIPSIRALAPFVPLSAASVVTLAATRGFGTMGPFVLVDNLGKPALRPILALVVLGLGLGDPALILSWALPIAAGLAVAIVALVRLLGKTERAGHPDRASSGEGATIGQIAGEFWRFASPRGLAGVFAIGLTWIDILLVGGLRGAHDAGIYAAASRYIVVGLVPVQALQLVIGPMLSALNTLNEHERVGAAYVTATQWLVLGAWPIYLTLATFAPFLLRVFGAEFVAGQHALVVLSLAGLVVTGAGPSQTMLLMAGRSGWTLVTVVLSLTLNVVLNVVLIPRMGIEGAAVAWAASLTFNNAASLLQIRLLLGLSPFSGGMGLVAGAAVLCYGVLGTLFRLTLGQTLPSFLLFGVVATVAYALMLWPVGRLLNLPMLGDVLRARARGRGGRAAADLVPQPRSGSLEL